MKIGRAVKGVAALAVLCFFAVSVPENGFMMTAQAAYNDSDPVEGDFSYWINWQGDSVVGKYLGNDSKVVIPSELGGRQVVSVNDTCFRLKDGSINPDVTEIVLPEGIQSLGQSMPPNLKKINIPSTVEKFWPGYINRAAQIELSPDNSYYCSISGSIYSKDMTTLYRATDGEVFHVPESVTTIGSKAFSKCSSLKEVYLPEGLETLGEGSFYFCKSLKEIILPASLTTIERDVFGWCISLEQVVQKGTEIQSIGAGAFYKCERLKKFDLPESITTIEKEVFCWCISLEQVVLKGTEIQSIGAGAFCKCERLKKFDLPESITTIGDSAFSSCISLERITIPGNVTYIPERCFQGCRSLKEVMIPSGVKEIGKFSFLGCKSLTEIGIPATVEKLGDELFAQETFDIYYLNTVYFWGTETQWNAIEKGDKAIRAKVVFASVSPITYVENTNSGILLKWDKMDWSNGYLLSRRENVSGSSWTQIKEITGNEILSWTDDSAKNGKNYCYAVVGFVGDDYHVRSERKGRCTITRLSTPSVTKAVNIVQGVHVYWERNSGATGYDLYRSLTKTGGYTKIISTQSTDYIDKNAVSGTRYYYKVKSVGEFGKSQASAARSTIFLDTPDITSRANSVEGIRIYWNKANGAKAYAIYRKGDGANDKWLRVGLTASNTLVWTDPDTKSPAANGTVYHYTVRAIAGSSLEVLSGCRTTGRTMVRLNKPVIYSMEKKGAGTVLGTWSRNDKATGYEVRFMVGTEVYKTFVYGNNTIVKKTISGLPTGKTYKIQVRSYYKTESAGTYYSSWSDAVNVKL